MSQIKKIIKWHIQIATRYNKEFENVNWIQRPKGFRARKAVYQTYHILIDEKKSRNRVQTDLKTRGIESNLGAQAIPLLTYYQRKYGYRPSDFPKAVKSFKTGLALPIGAHVQPKDVAYISNALKSIEEHTR